MALIAQSLVTADEIDGVLQTQNATYDAVIEQLANAVSQEFATYAGRLFISAVYTSVKLTGDGTSRLLLPAWPVTVLTSVVEDTVTRVVDVDFYADMDNGILTKAEYNWPWYDEYAVWTTKTQAIVVTYTGGYAQASLPWDLKQAALDEIAYRYQRFVLKEWGAASRSQEGSSTSFKELEKPDWQRVVRQYRRWRL